MAYKLYVGGLENLRKTRLLTDIVKDFAVEKENKLSQLGTIDITNYDFSLHVRNEDYTVTLQFRHDNKDVVTCSVNNGYVQDLIVTEEAGSEIVNFHDAKDVLETLSNQFDLGAREFGDKRTLAICLGRLSIVQLKKLDNTDVLKDSQGNIIVYDSVEDAAQAAVVMTSYKNMNREVQDKLAHMSHSFGAVQDVNNLTELADMISQGLSKNKDFVDGLAYGLDDLIEQVENAKFGLDLSNGLNDLKDDELKR